MFFEFDQRKERVKGVEPSSLAWKAIALPLSYTRGLFHHLRMLNMAFQSMVLG